MALTNGPKLGLLVNGDIGEEHYDELMAQWRGLDALIQASVIDNTLTAPPVSPADGDTYIVAASATGDWATHDGKLARWNALAPGAWEFFTPKEGWSVWVESESDRYRFDGTDWVSAGVDTFVGRPDTPANYSGAAGKFVRVNSGGTAVEFSAGELAINAQTGTTYTLVLSDAGKLVTLDNAAAITLYVPEDASVDFPVGTQILIAQLDAQVTVAEGAIGVTIITPETLKLRKTGSQAALVKIAADTWLLAGDIEAA
jgi:hypothetical protein